MVSKEVPKFNPVTGERFTSLERFACTSYFKTRRKVIGISAVSRLATGMIQMEGGDKSYLKGVVVFDRALHALNSIGWDTTTAITIAMQIREKERLDRGH